MLDGIVSVAPAELMWPPVKASVGASFLVRISLSFLGEIMRRFPAESDATPPCVT
jgi:hypothetical protein